LYPGSTWTRSICIWSIASMRRLRARFIFLLTLPLCLGQECSAPTTIHPGVPSAIPAGTYSGRVSTTSRLLVGNVLQSEQTAVADQSQSFGDTGEPLGKDDLPLYVGGKETRTITGMDVTLTVASIQSTTGGVTINYTAALTLTAGASTYKMTGTGQAGFTLVSAGSIDYQMSLDLSYTGANGSVVSLQLDSEGTFYR
jgi:hypothetical protein